LQKECIPSANHACQHATPFGLRLSASQLFLGAPRDQSFLGNSVADRAALEYAPNIMYLHYLTFAQDYPSCLHHYLSFYFLFSAKKYT
jgi:hypothetical protein